MSESVVGSAFDTIPLTSSINRFISPLYRPPTDLPGLGRTVEGVFSISDHAFSSTFIVPSRSAPFPLTIHHNIFRPELVAYTFTTDLRGADDPSDSTGPARLYYENEQQLQGKHTYEAQFNSEAMTFVITLDNGVRITGQYGPSVQVTTALSGGHGIWDGAPLFLPIREYLPTS